MKLVGKLWIFLLKKFVFGDPKKCAHEWVVYSRALNQNCLELHCSNCALVGTVDNPTDEEWSRAFGANSKPYSWPANERVSVGTHQML
jgi:hypothetical protein